MTDWIQYNRDLMLCVAASIATEIILLWSHAPRLLEIPSGIVTVCILPGYFASVIAAPWRDISLVDRAVFTLGASMALTALLGIVINYSSDGITRDHWRIGFAILLSLSAYVAFLRRWNPFSSTVAHLPRNSRAWLRLDRNLTTAGTLALLLLGVALWYSRSDARRAERSAQVTTLWITRNSSSRSIQIGASYSGPGPLHARIELSARSSFASRAWSRHIVLRRNHAWSTTLTNASYDASSGATARLYSSTGKQLRWVRLVARPEQGEPS